MKVRRYPSAGALTEAAAERFVDVANTAIVDRGRFTVALAGGSTPRTLYRLLATDRYATRIDWQHVHVLWGDERCVPPDHGNSNYRMADEELLSKVPLPRENVHRIRGEIKPNAAAAEYERLLQSFFHVRDAANDRRAVIASTSCCWAWAMMATRRLCSLVPRRCSGNYVGSRIAGSWRTSLGVWARGA